MLCFVHMVLIFSLARKSVMIASLRVCLRSLAGVGGFWFGCLVFEAGRAGFLVSGVWGGISPRASSRLMSGILSLTVTNFFVGVRRVA